MLREFPFPGEGGRDDGVFEESEACVVFDRASGEMLSVCVYDTKSSSYVVAGPEAILANLVVGSEYSKKYIISRPSELDDIVRLGKRPSVFPTERHEYFLDFLEGDDMNLVGLLEDQINDYNYAKKIREELRDSREK